MSEQQVAIQIEELDTKLDILAKQCAQLRLENRSLLEQQQNLVEERARLIEKNEMARTKVESMITRLKSLEASQ